MSQSAETTDTGLRMECSSRATMMSSRSPITCSIATGPTQLLVGKGAVGLAWRSYGGNKRASVLPANLMEAGR